jgi:hypothetical protein
LNWIGGVVKQIPKSGPFSLLVVFALALLVCPISSNRAIGQDSLQFSVSMDKNVFLRCEEVWMYFKVKNLSRHPLNLQYPSFYAGNIVIRLRLASGDSVVLRDASYRIQQSDHSFEQRFTLGPSDSLIGFMDMGGQYGAAINPEGSTLCHNIGSFDAMVTYLPTGSNSTIQYEVVEPTSAVSQELKELEAINRVLFTTDFRATERRIDSFLSKYPSAVYVPKVLHLKTLLYLIPKNENVESFLRVSTEIIQRFPNSPASIIALNDLLKKRSAVSNESLLRNLAKGPATLIGQYASRTLTTGGFKHLSKDSE